MTIQDGSELRTQSFVGDGVTTTFFLSQVKFAQPEDVLVFVDTVQQTAGNDYTISGDGLALTGELEFTVAPANLADIDVVRDTQLRQSGDFGSQTSFKPENFGQALDDLARQVHDTRLYNLPLKVDVPAAGIVPDSVLAFDALGLPITKLLAEFGGWSPILAVVEDGERRVHQIVDWTGGAGTKPITGYYLSSAGLTLVITEATDVRGSQGLSGDGSGDVLAINNLNDLQSIVQARINMGLQIGADVQAYHAKLAALAALAGGADKLPYFTGADALGQVDFGAFSRQVVGQADLAGWYTQLALTIATQAQAEAGNDNEVRMTPLRTRQLVQALFSQSGGTTPLPLITASGLFDPALYPGLTGIEIEVQGAGGNGGDADGGQGGQNGGDGGFGTYARAFIGVASLQEAITITIAGGGSGAATTFGTLISCPAGGNGGNFGGSNGSDGGNPTGSAALLEALPGVTKFGRVASPRPRNGQVGKNGVGYGAPGQGGDAENEQGAGNVDGGDGTGGCMRIRVIF